jgi:hypothetical protein
MLVTATDGPAVRCVWWVDGVKWRGTMHQDDLDLVARR